MSESLFGEWLSIKQEIIDLRSFFDKNPELNGLKKKIHNFHKTLYDELGTD